MGIDFGLSAQQNSDFQEQYILYLQRNMLDNDRLQIYLLHNIKTQRLSLWGICYLLDEGIPVMFVA